MITAKTTTARPKPRRRWRQFSLGTLLFVATLCAFACSWLAIKIKQGREQREIAAVFEKIGGDVEWLDVPLRAKWLQALISDDLFRNIGTVTLGFTPITDAGLERLEGLRHLESLGLMRTKVGDAGLEHLQTLYQLERLGLEGTQVTDAGLQHLKGLTHLVSLNLSRTQIADAGLGHLAGLGQLQFLYLNGTRVTDNGVGHLRSFKQLVILDLDDTRVTHAGLRHIGELNQLKELRLRHTPVTDAGLEHLKGLSRLRILLLTGTEITNAGLESLKAMEGLAYLDLEYTQVNKEGVERLRRALPKCEIGWEPLTEAPMSKQPAAFFDNPDFVICSSHFDMVVTHYGDNPRACDLPVVHRTVLLAWAATGAMSDGFEYLLSDDYRGDPGFKLTTQAFEDIGCQPAADAFKEALALFPGGVPMANLDERKKFFESVPKAKRDELNNRFWAVSHDGKLKAGYPGEGDFNVVGEICRKLTAYIRAHAAEFASLKPQ